MSFDDKFDYPRDLVFDEMWYCQNRFVHQKKYTFDEQLNNLLNNVSRDKEKI